MICKGVPLPSKWIPQKNTIAYEIQNKLLENWGYAYPLEDKIHLVC